VQLLRHETWVCDRFRLWQPTVLWTGQARQCATSLELVCEPVFVGDIREREHLLSASITLDSTVDTTHLFLEFQTAGVSFHQTLKAEPWGAINFVVMDPDRNLILFSGPAD
jgi:hypothetical protein